MRVTAQCIYCSHNGIPGVHEGEHPTNEYIARKRASAKGKLCKSKYERQLKRNALEAARAAVE